MRERQESTIASDQPCIRDTGLTVWDVYRRLLFVSDHEVLREFPHWCRKVDLIFIDVILHPTDETAPNWDTFNVVEELANPKVSIPFDGNAEFTGDSADLTEFYDEMWSKGF